MTKEDLINKAAEEYAKAAFFVSQQWVATGKELFKAGIEWRDNNLWHPADGDDLPELEREVVVFTQNFPDDVGIMKVGIAHRPNPNGWDGRNILTGEVNHYTPKTYDKGGWSLPDVKIWLDCKLPFKEGGEE